MHRPKIETGTPVNKIRDTLDMIIITLMVVGISEAFVLVRMDMARPVPEKWKVLFALFQFAVLGAAYLAFRSTPDQKRNGKLIPNRHLDKGE